MRRRSRSRSRGGRRGLSRRTLLGVGVAAVGGALLVAQSEAFSQSQARREASVDAADDSEALVGVSTASSVVAGTDDQELVTIANNTGRELSVSVELADSDDGTVTESTAVIGADDAHTFLIDVDVSVDPGDGNLPFVVEATGEDSFHTSMERQVDVEEPDESQSDGSEGGDESQSDDGENADEPPLQWSVSDETRNNNAAFSIAYQINASSQFDRLELDVENVDTTRGRDRSESFTTERSEGVISYPSSGTDGGTAGDTYEFEFRIYDADDQLLVSELTERVAGKQSDDDEFGDEEDPRLETVTITDESDPGTDRAQFTVDYEVSNLDKFGEVVVTFDHQDHSWSDRTVANESVPTGTVTYPVQGGTSNDVYEITTEIRRESGLTVDSRTIAVVADGEDPSPYSRG